jgi:excisionase family DNA binding protein
LKNTEAPHSSACHPLSPFSRQFATHLLPADSEVKGAGGQHLRALRGGAEDLLTVRQVATGLSISTATVYKLVERGELPHVRISNAVRVAPEDLAAFLRRRRISVR